MLRRIAVLLLCYTFCFAKAWSIDTITVGLTSAPPFIIGNDDNAKGINIWLWERIAKDIDVTYKYEVHSFGDLLMKLENGEIDVCINPLTMTAERSKKFLFTSPFYVSRNVAAIKTQKKERSGLFSILDPLMSKRFLGGLVLLFGLICFFGGITWLAEHKANALQFRSGWKGVADGLWWSIVTMTTVGYGDKTPKTNAGKVIAVMWMLTAILFISTLTASLASLLVDSDSEQTSISSIDDLRGEQVGTMARTSTYDMLHQRFFQNVNTYDNINTGLQDLDNDNIKSFIYDEAILKYRIQQNDLRSIDLIYDQNDNQLYSFGVSKEKQELNNEIAQRILHYTSSVQWKGILGEYNL